MTFPAIKGKLLVVDTVTQLIEPVQKIELFLKIEPTQKN